MASQTENPGEVLFCRGQNDTGDSDIWDDTALVQAYDHAVNNVKDQIAEKSGNAADAENSEQPTPHGPGQKKKNKRNKRKKNHGWQANWQVGNHCRAVYTEDGQVYEAIIMSMNVEMGTCTVRFLGYGNTEELQLQDLLRPESSGGRRNPDIPSSNASVASVKEEISLDHSQGAFPRPFPLGRGGGLNGMPQLFNPTGFPQAFMAPPPAFMPMMPNVPPPPPLEDENNLQNDDEALHSMLIAWYMSGYHTGYYQGLKEGKKSVNRSKQGNRNQRRKPQHQQQAQSSPQNDITPDNKDG